ncbi:Protein CBR-ECH-5 [Caenorhabditis briggsae]|uniref:enoyl-CoA hydratase n=1 Tax=Caenorhabditis briggsae TaxID=6238 RepID=A8WJK2_CAEBR|nr:Protein CBR-ECH-5 [Caenorhabditis briggsae]CAP20645.1 Protein CBR-ECH-5 [Caenorhabditis briggsae]
MLTQKLLLNFRSLALRPLAYSTTSDPKNEVFLERLTGKDEGITIVNMNRPEKKNSLGKVFMAQFREVLEEIKYDPKTRVVILNSKCENVFCSGADLKERKTMSQQEATKFVNGLRDSFTDVERLPQPVIAAIDGFALGGGLELALACDIRVASQKSKMGLVETKWALIPGAGGSQRLYRIVGVAKAKELIYTAAVFDGSEAEKLGVVNHCVASNPIDKSIDIARKLKKMLISTLSRRFASSATVTPTAQKWDIFASVILSRPPIIAPKMSEIEERFQKLQKQEEEEKSLLCNYELKTKQDLNQISDILNQFSAIFSQISAVLIYFRAILSHFWTIFSQISDILNQFSAIFSQISAANFPLIFRMVARREQLLREGKELSELDEEIGVTNAQKEDDWSKAAADLDQKFKFGANVLAENAAENLKSVDRALERKLVLIVKQKMGGGAEYSSPWILPQMKHREGETLRQTRLPAVSELLSAIFSNFNEFWTAERCIGELSGSADLSVDISGNAPFGVFTHSQFFDISRYPKPIAQKTGASGAKIFFYTANLAPSTTTTSSSSESFSVNPEDVSDFQWVTREEFWSTVPGTDYKKARFPDSKIMIFGLFSVIVLSRF